MVLLQGGIRGHDFPFPYRVLLGDVFSQRRELFLEQQLQVFDHITHLGFCSRTLLII